MNINQAGDKNDENINSYGYSEGYILPTTAEQDNIARETFVSISENEEYSFNPFNPNQCATVTQKALNAAGIKTARNNMRIVQRQFRQKEYVIDMKPYLPSCTFKSIIRYNPNGQIINRKK